MKRLIPTVWQPFTFLAVFSAICLGALVLSRDIYMALIIFIAFLPVVFVFVADILGRHRAKLMELEYKLNAQDFRITQLEQHVAQLEAQNASAPKK